MAFEHFPYTNFHELNLDWLLNKVKELSGDIEDWKAVSSIKFANPIEWSANNRYDPFTIVLGPDGNSYLSSKHVPAGVDISNSEYWQRVANTNAQLESLLDKVRDTTTAGKFDAVRLFRDFEYRNQSDLPWYNPDIQVANRMQGGCYDAAEQKYYIVYWDNVNQELDYNKLVVYDEVGTILNSITFNAGWCNGLTVDNDYIYVCVRGNHNGTVNTVRKYSKHSLVLVDTIDTPRHYKSLYYHNDIMYAMDDNLGVYAVDKTTFNALSMYAPPFDSTDNVQNFAIEDGLVYYIISDRNAIRIYDTASGYIKQYTAPERFSNSYVAGELQWITVHNHKIRFGSSTSIWNIATIQNIFETNLVDGFIADNFYASSYSKTHTIYVDANSTLTNPTGAEDKPFKHLEEAIACAEAYTTIHIAAGTYNSIYICNNEYLELQADDGDSVIIQYGAYIRRSSNINIIGSNISINGALANNAALAIDKCASVICRLGSITGTGTYSIYNSASQSVVNAPNITPTLVYERYGTLSSRNDSLGITTAYYSPSYLRCSLSSNSTHVLNGSIVVDKPEILSGLTAHPLMYVSYYGANDTNISTDIFIASSSVKHFIGRARATSNALRNASAVLNITSSGVTISDNYGVTTSGTSSVTLNIHDGSTAAWSDNYPIHITDIGYII